MTTGSRSLSGAFAWTLTGRVVYGACQWAILSVLTKLGDTTLVGRFALALAVTAPLSVFSSLQLRGIYATDVDDKYTWATYWSLRVRLTAACVVALVAVAWGTPSLHEDAWVIVIVAVAKGVEMVQDLMYGVFQRHRAMQHFGRSLMLRGAGGLAAIAGALALHLPLEVGVGGMLLAWAAVLVVHDGPRAHSLRGSDGPTGERGSSSSLLWLALPMGVVMLLDSLNQNVPRYLIEWHGGTAELGVYVAMAYVIQIGGTVVFALGAPLASTLARDYVELARESFMRRTVALLGLTAALGLAGIGFAGLFGEPFLRLAYSAEVSASAHVFVWVMVAAACHYIIVMCNNVLTAARYLRIQPVVWGAALLTTTACGWRWIAQHGIVGAAQAFSAGVAVGAVLAVGSVVVAIRAMAAAR